MVRVEKTAVIDRPQEEVFAWAADPANASKWQTVVQAKRWTSEGPPAVGSTQEVTARWLGFTIASTNAYTVWDPPHETRFQTRRGPLRVEEGMRFAAEGQGSKVTWEMTIDGGGIFRLLDGFLRRQAEQTMGMDLAALKHLLEAGAG